MGARGFGASRLISRRPSEPFGQGAMALGVGRRRGGRSAGHRGPGSATSERAHTQCRRRRFVLGRASSFLGPRLVSRAWPRVSVRAAREKRGGGQAAKQSLRIARAAAIPSRRQLEWEAPSRRRPALPDQTGKRVRMTKPRSIGRHGTSGLPNIHWSAASAVSDTPAASDPGSAAAYSGLKDQQKQASVSLRRRSLPLEREARLPKPMSVGVRD